MPVSFISIARVTFSLLAVNFPMFLNGGFAFIGTLPGCKLILLLTGYISLNYCRVCQLMSTPVLPRPENVTAETLTGFGFVGL